MRNVRTMWIVAILVVISVLGLTAVHGAGGTPAPPAVAMGFGSGKLCSAVNPSNWRDTVPMPDAATEAACQSWKTVVGASTYQLGCMSASGTVDLGPDGGGAPSPNCGW
jgi:hypothetical protein